MYDAARARGIPPAALTDITDVLLYNPEGSLTETSVYNIAFYRNRKWVTPKANSGCLPGVMRRWLLEQGRIKEMKEPLTKDDLQVDECVLIFNGVRGCRLGRIAD